MGRRKALFKEQAHRVALVTKARLDADKDVSEMLPENKDIAAIRLDPPRGRTPSCLDCIEWRSGAHDRFGINLRRDVGLLPVLLRITAQNSGPQIVHRFGDVDLIAVGPHRLHRVVQAFKDAEIGGRSDCPGIRWEPKKNDAHFLVRVPHPSQSTQAQGLFRQAVDPLGARHHRLWFGAGFALMSTPLAA